MGNVRTILDTTGNALKNIGDVAFYLLHPGMIFQALWNYTVLYSFWVCMLVAIISLMLYGFGFKKCAKYAPTSIALYSLIRVLSKVI